MKPTRTLGEARTPDGARLTFQEHDGEFFLRLDGRPLMSSRATVSERMLAQLACAPPFRPKPRILIGGLGFGFTLKEVLEKVGPESAVHVAELLPEVVAWNREFLGGVNGRLLDDPRVEVFVDDVFNLIQRARPLRYDSIILDVDNGPVAMVASRNSRLYDRHGFGLIARALNPGGRAVFWSASEDAPFFHRLSKAGFNVRVFECKSHETARQSAHRIYVATVGAAK